MRGRNFCPRTVHAAPLLRNAPVPSPLSTVNLIPNTTKNYVVIAPKSHLPGGLADSGYVLRRGSTVSPSLSASGLDCSTFKLGQSNELWLRSEAIVVSSRPESTLGDLCGNVSGHHWPISPHKTPALFSPQFPRSAICSFPQGYEHKQRLLL